MIYDKIVKLLNGLTGKQDHPSGLTVNRWAESATRAEDIKDVIFLRPPQGILKLNETYTAELTEAGVKVGCTTFSKDKVLELARMIQENK